MVHLLMASSRYDSSLEYPQYNDMQEHGPYRVTEEDGALTYNEFSWNQYANVLYLEGPVGVGFSINNQEDITTNDELAADNNYYALHDFMTRLENNVNCVRKIMQSAPQLRPERLLSEWTIVRRFENK